MTIRLRSADTADVAFAAALLCRAVLSSRTGRLLGSATTHCRATFGELLTASRCFGRVDLAVSGDRIDGVACWIDHIHGPIRPPTRVARDGLDDLYARLHTIDLVVGVPDGNPHQHLACLGTRPGHNARASTDLLLHHQSRINDRDGHTFYTEVHDLRLRAWLLRCGYDDHGVSLGTDTDTESYLMSYAGTGSCGSSASPAPATEDRERRL